MPLLLEILQEITERFVQNICLKCMCFQHECLFILINPRLSDTKEEISKIILRGTLVNTIPKIMANLGPRRDLTVYQKHIYLFI